MKNYEIKILTRKMQKVRFCEGEDKGDGNQGLIKVKFILVHKDIVAEYQSCMTRLDYNSCM